MLIIWVSRDGCEELSHCLIQHNHRCTRLAIVSTLDGIVTHMPHQVVLPVNSTVLTEHVMS